MTARPILRLVAASLLVAATACGTQGLSFEKDERVEIVAPKDRAAVRLPFEVRWTVHDFTVSAPSASPVPNAGFFGVFVDRAPQPPNETFRWFARNDVQCKTTPGCPDEAYFAAKQIYATTQTSFVVDRLPEVRAERERKFRDLHEVIVVLLDSTGRRIGESAFKVEFELKRSAD